MAIPSGTRFGAFEVVSPLGEGGMGEVYRARDTRLNRDVALKILPDAFARDPDRLARFQREAQVLASLNHPNIAAIHGLEDAQGRHVLILELVEGPTLADRIAQGPVPLDEALPISRQIAEALEAAHEQGIVHRDLKPANVKVRPDGTVKVLDFGLAKAMSRADGGSSVAPPDVTASPTMVSPATMTSAGVILGTAAYMAPEQARGKGVDRRADIWAFGCVLYEMLTGRRAFGGEEITDTLAGILRGDPDWAALPPSTPPPIQTLLRRCLEKNPRDRLQAIGDARLEIVEAMTHRNETPSATAVPTSSRMQRTRAMAAASAVTALLASALTWALKPAPPAVERSVTRSILDINPFDQRSRKPGEAKSGILRTSRNALALSPDGRTLVFRGNDAGTWQLYLRRLDTLTATLIPGTSGGDSPFFSAGGQWIGYVDAGELRRVPATGGSTSYTPVTRLPAGDTRIWGASWGEDDVIVFSTADALWRVPASGGKPEQIAKTRDDEYMRVLPHLLPGGRSLLFTVQKSVSQWDDTQTVVRSLATGEERVLLSDAMDARYAPSGHLVFMRRGRLMAAPFDLERLEMTGPGVAVADDVMQSINWGNTLEETGAGQYAFATEGALVYVTGGVPPDEPRELVWVRREGTVEVIPAPVREYVSPRVSPDGQRILAFTQASDRDGGSRLWSYDLVRRTSTSLGSPDDRASWALWSPDGTRVAFQRILPGGRGVLSTASADGPGASAPMASGGHVAPLPLAWTRGGLMAFVDFGETTETDIWVLDTRSNKAEPILKTPAVERLGVLSSDGRWLAYTSDDAGRQDVYIQPYPGPGARVLVSASTEGGFAPTLREDNGELFYYTANDGLVTMYAVPLTVGSDRLTTGTARKLFSGEYISSSPGRGYDVTPDGQRFVMVRNADRPPTAGPSTMVLVENWFEELTRFAPATR